ncbi:MAG: hypothetical protein IT318_05725 [Anaerolineales bacterium]|nr:hypothetical protein [Anaerolineales bacterium]
MLARLAEPYRQVFRFYRFCNFWLGFSASLAGDALSRVALTWCDYEAAGSAQMPRMRVIPDTPRGRAFALLRTLMPSAGPLGGLLAG